MFINLNEVKILLIEDLRLAQVAALNIFKQLNCKPYIVPSAKEAVDMLLRCKFDIIFSDIMLPEIDGYEIAKTIRSMERRKHLPIIAVTANSNPDLEFLIKKSGFDDFIVKPLTLESVRYILAKYLSKTVSQT